MKRRAVRPRPVSESAFQRQVTDLAAVLGWEWAHFRKARVKANQAEREAGREWSWRTPVSGTIGKGWPDLVLAHQRQRRLIFAELKRESEKPSAEQEAVLWVLAELGKGEVYVWRPSMLDAIAQVLRGAAAAVHVSAVVPKA